jgi:hypothetical protein
VLTSLTCLPITWVWRRHVTRRCFKGKIQSSLSSRHPVPTLTPLPLCSGTSKRLSMGRR